MDPSSSPESDPELPQLVPLSPIPLLTPTKRKYTSPKQSTPKKRAVQRSPSSGPPRSAKKRGSSSSNQVPSTSRRQLDFGNEDNDNVNVVCADGDHSCNTSFATYESGSGGGSSGRWLDKITPKSDWTCTKIKDLGFGEGATCEMCNREKIRYVHTVAHANHESLKVGCICAGHLTGDLELVKRRQDALEGRAARRKKFPTLKNWKMSANRRDYINLTRRGIKYWIVITQWNGKFSSRFENKNTKEQNYLPGANPWSNTIEQAKLAIFDYLWPDEVEIKDDQDVSDALGDLTQLD